MLARACFLVLVTVCCAMLAAEAQNAPATWTHLIGAGVYDITGPAYGVGMMGYAMVQQFTKGIHFRLRARAFIFVDPVSERRVVFVSNDLCFTTPAVKQAVIEGLQKIFGPTLYTEENVMLSATHTHAGPGGYSYHPLYDISTFGFHDQNFEAIVNGIVNAIVIAHKDLTPGRAGIKIGQLLGSSANRSPTAYMANPPEERAQYEHNTDKQYTVLDLSSISGQKVGLIGWFAVHGTSMNNTNLYISGDNKGYASYLLEKEMAQRTGAKYVAAVAQSNEGDSSPNILGAFCDDGTPCDAVHSTCGGFSQTCHAYGPGKTDFESTKIIGHNQYQAVRMARDSGNFTYLGNDIRYMHLWVDMEATTVSPEYSGTGKAAKTCVGALGDSFAAGTTDGPGEFDFVQGTNDSNTNWYWNWLTSKILAAPTEEDLDCHAPKPILFMTGRILFPGKWTQGVIPLQVFKIGQLWLVGVPGEFSTMAGRRLRNRVQQALVKAGAWTSETHIVLAGLSNSYTHYITTREEYAYQRYEGASTLFGPFTLNAYEMLYSDLAMRIAKSMPPPPSAKPENMSSAIFYLQPPVSPDEIPAGISFGAVYKDPLTFYMRGSTVEVIFWAGNPRNNLRIEGTFLEVQRQGEGSWTTVANDGDWETKFWFDYVPNGGHARITWEIPPTTIPGTYRIVHYGDYKDGNKKIHPYTGASRVFTVQ